LLDLFEHFNENKTYIGFDYISSHFFQKTVVCLGDAVLYN